MMTITFLPLLVGMALAIAASAEASRRGFDRQRAFYPALLLAIGSFYVVFAIAALSPGAVVDELIWLGLFAILAGAGYRTSLWIIVIAIAATASSTCCTARFRGRAFLLGGRDFALAMIWLQRHGWHADYGPVLPSARIHGKDDR